MDDRLDERVDRWLDRGRRLVDGVSGTRPGARAGGRGAERRGDPRAAAAGLGRWVEDRLDRLLEDGDDWREPWEEETARPAAPRRAPKRRPLEAVSRRGARPAPIGESGPRAAAAAESPASPVPDLPPRNASVGESAAPAAGPDDWPADDAFTPNRWRRGEPAAPAADPAPRVRGTAPETRRGGRPLPRSSRRR